MVKTAELMALLKTGNSDAARKLIAKLKKSGEWDGNKRGMISRWANRGRHGSPLNTLFIVLP